MKHIVVIEVEADNTSEYVKKQVHNALKANLNKPLVRSKWDIAELDVSATGDELLASARDTMAAFHAFMNERVPDIIPVMEPLFEEIRDAFNKLNVISDNHAKIGEHLKHLQELKGALPGKELRSAFYVDKNGVHTTATLTQKEIDAMEPGQVHYMCHTFAEQKSLDDDVCSMSDDERREWLKKHLKKETH